MKNDFNGIYDVRLYGHKILRHGKLGRERLLGTVYGAIFSGGVNSQRLSFGLMSFVGRATLVEVGTVARKGFVLAPNFGPGDECVIYPGDLTVTTTS